MSKHDPSVVRDHIFSSFTKANKAGEGHVNMEELKEVKSDFLDEQVADAGAIMYSSTFKGADDYLLATGKPDINITSLMHEVSDWPEDDQGFIPSVDPHYKWQHDILYPALLGLLGKMKVLFVGPTGSGKTTFHENLAGTFNQPFYRLGGRGDMESDVILGRQDIQDGSMDFLLGEFTKKYISNYYILLDEPWKLPANINMTFQRVFERNGLLQIDEARGELKDKQFYPGPHTHLMLADNVVGTGDGADRYSATMIQDGSTINRMDMVLKIDYLKPEDEVAMLMDRFSAFLPKHIASKAVQVANLVRNGVDEGQLSVTMSPRNLIAWMEMAHKVRSYEESFKWVMLQRYADDSERGAVEGMYFTAFAKQL
jgi:cobaltochelatase CobS